MLHPSDALDMDIWHDALEVMRKSGDEHGGMGSCTLKWNPYEGKWEFEINFSDNRRYRGKGRLDAAISMAIEEFKEYKTLEIMRKVSTNEHV